MKAQPFTRLAVVNRGEAAMRLIHAARELSNETGRPLRVIALYTDADARSLFVREADEAVPLGPALVDDGTGKLRSAYLDHARVLRALAECGAEAVWVGWGFVAEDAAFAQACEERGLVFVGPPSNVMRRLGDKIEAKRLAESLGLPVAAWSGGPVDDATAMKLAPAIGFPLLVKAAQAGGGRGIRRVEVASELAGALASARAEAVKAFGEGAVYLEKLVGAARHVEVQVIADAYGNAWAVGVRDCTIQRRNQKVVEEAPCAVLSPELEARVKDLSVKLAREAGYVNAGTVEWLYEPEHERFSLMEVNTRLQVEHPVTELTSGVDLVKMQLAVASGEHLGDPPPPSRGHAVEVRLCAEDPDNGFAPAPGELQVLRFATGTGIRIDTGVAEGDRIASEFDSMIAKVIAYGSTRNEALARLRRALAQSTVLVKEGATNKAFLTDILSDPDYVACRTNTGWLDKKRAGGAPVPRPHGDVALFYAAILAHERELALAANAFVEGRRRGKPPRLDIEVELHYAREAYQLAVRRTAKGSYRIEVAGTTTHVEVDQGDGADTWMSCHGERHRIVAITHGEQTIVEVDGVPHRIDADQGNVVRAPAPAIILSVQVKPGQVVAPGDPLVSLEAMKMEIPVRAPMHGRVKTVKVVPNVQVPTGAPLVELEPSERDGAQSSTQRLDFGPPPGREPPLTPAAECRRALLAERAFLLGYDLEAKAVRERWQSAAPHLGVIDDEPELVDLEHEVLDLFVTLCQVVRRPRGGGETPTPSALEQLLATWRRRDGGAPALAADASGSLKRAVELFGVKSLDRSSRLERALLQLDLGYRRLREELEPVLRLLARPRSGIDPAADPKGTARLRALLDRVIAASPHLDAVNDLARRVQHGYLDAPAFERAREETYRHLGQQLDLLAKDPSKASESEAMRELVECPHSLLSWLGPRFEAGSSDLAPVLLELFLRRYYSDRGLSAMSTVLRAGRPFVSARLVGDGRPLHILTTTGRRDELARLVTEGAALLGDVPPDADIAFDCIITDTATTTAPELVRELTGTLSGVTVPRLIRRLCVSVLRPQQQSVAGYFTFRVGPGELVLAEPNLDVHPMMADRLELGRLSLFTTTRLPAPEDVFLFHAVAKDNPKDERLFAFINIRDLTAVRDDHGRVAALPHLEQRFLDAVAAIRAFKAQHPDKSLNWNRILLYLRPPAQLRIREVRRVISRVARATRGVGLEKVVARVRLPDSRAGGIVEYVLHLSLHEGNVARLRQATPATTPIRTLGAYKLKVAEARRRGMTYPYEIVRMLTPREAQPAPHIPPGRFVEYDLDASGQLVAVDRPYGENQANVVVGVITSLVKRYEPQGIRRVLVLSDPTREMGALAEPECRRIIAALELAAAEKLPVDWFPISSGAKIAMNSGTENLDWTARVLRRLVELTEAGLEVNVVVDGVNVGAQSYWNAEATMIMHCRGILIMTPEGSMVLTGKSALDYSGAVSAEDHQGIGGAERIMGPNGEAQYAATDLTHACEILMAHHELAYVVPGERFPRPVASRDPTSRDVTVSPYEDDEGLFCTVGDIFSLEKNPGKKKPFDIRKVMAAVADADQAPLERWAMMHNAETGVIWDTRLGGNSVTLVGIESKRVTRSGFVPPDGPTDWTGGTLFPQSSKKVARAIYAASGRRPVVVLANLSGFDGSPESMRKLQLEYGAEIGRAVVKFDGPIVFCVISRYHGGAYVVFSRALNDGLEVAALEGTYASVIGGAPAAAVVFARDVRSLTNADPRIKEMRRALEQASASERPQVQAKLEELVRTVHNQKLGEVAEKFDQVHSVQRAREVGSVQHIVAPRELRPYLVAALTRGLERFGR